MKYHYSRQMQNFGAQHPGFNWWHAYMPRKVRVWDNGGTTVDRFTVAILRTQKGKQVADVYTMSLGPTCPQGVNMYSHTTAHDIRYSPFMDFVDTTKDTRIAVHDLPDDVISAIEARI